MERFGIYLDEKKIGETSTALDRATIIGIMNKQSDDFPKGKAWELAGIYAVEVFNDLPQYRGLFQYYLRRGRKLYLRGGGHRLAVEFDNDQDLKEALAQMEFGKYYQIKFNV